MQIQTLSVVPCFYSVTHLLVIESKLNVCKKKRSWTFIQILLESVFQWLTLCLNSFKG